MKNRFYQLMKKSALVLIASLTIASMNYQLSFASENYTNEELTASGQTIEEAQEEIERIIDENPEDPLNFRAQGEYDEAFDEPVPRPKLRMMLSRSTSTNNRVTFNGVDVSHHQGTINWTTMKNKVNFAIIRAGYRGYEEGTLGTDTKFAENMRGAINNNIAVGVYFFSQATTTAEAEEEADRLMELVEPYKNSITLPLVIDYEYVSTATGLGGRLYKANLTKNQATEVVNAFCDRVEANGYRGMVYANKDMLTNRLDGANIAKNHRVWLAHYTNGGNTTYTGAYDFWQYTSEGDGISYGASSKYIDLDYGYYNFDDVEVFDYNVKLTIPSGYTDKNIWVDGQKYEGIVEGNTIKAQMPSSILGKAQIATMYKYNENGIPIGMTIWQLSYKNGGYVATELKNLKDLFSYHGFSIRVTGNSGIRFKSGIAENTKKNLIESNVDGFKLVEYGTICVPEAVLTKSNTSLVLNGNSVLQGKTYYLDNGTIKDSVFETIDGRARFANVVTDLKENMYGQNITFRAYGIFTKDQNRYVIYGPSVSRSIYTVANQVKKSGEFKEGSDPYKYIQNIIDKVDKQ